MMMAAGVGPAWTLMLFFLTFLLGPMVVFVLWGARGM